MDILYRIGLIYIYISKSANTLFGIKPLKYLVSKKFKYDEIKYKLIVTATRLV